MTVILVFVFKLQSDDNYHENKFQQIFLARSTAIFCVCSTVVIRSPLVRNIVLMRLITEIYLACKINGGIEFNFKIGNQENEVREEIVYNESNLQKLGNVELTNFVWKSRKLWNPEFAIIIFTAFRRFKPSEKKRTALLVDIERLPRASPLRVIL